LEPQDAGACRFWKEFLKEEF